MIDGAASTRVFQFVLPMKREEGSIAGENRNKGRSIR